MKKLLLILLLLCGMTPILRAADGCDQHLTRDEFRAKQKAFIMEKAELTKEEAAKFFPVYFELQDRKKKLNDESWDLVCKGKNDKTTDAEYGTIIEKITDNRIASDRLDKTYLDKFKKILPNRKIYLVQRAEMRFHRELLKNVQGKGGGHESQDRRK